MTRVFSEPLQTISDALLRVTDHFYPVALFWFYVFSCGWTTVSFPLTKVCFVLFMRNVCFLNFFCTSKNHFTGLLHTLFYCILFFIYFESIEILNFWLRMESSWRDVLALKSMLWLLQRAWVRFPAPTGCSIIICYYSSKRSDTIIWSLRAPTVQMVHIIHAGCVS